MNILAILFKLWPAIKDTFFGGLEFSSYIRRNKAITMLVLALIVTFSSFIYLYEEAFMHGAISKAKSQQILQLKTELNRLKKNVNKE